jgi:hypothetical protein
MHVRIKLLVLKTIGKMTKEEVLQNCTVEGTVVKLPEGQLDRKLYQEVAKALELIGGKWKGNNEISRKNFNSLLRLRN